MRKIVYCMQMSLDGYIEDASGGIGFTGPDRELHDYFNAQEAETDTHIYGRRLYETMNAFWPTAGDDPDAPPEIVAYARIWNAVDKIVFSRTLTSVEGRARLAGPDIAAEVAALKATPGKEVSLGGATLAKSFIDLGLVDEYRVVIYPVLLGGGKAMFGPLARQAKLRLIDSRTFGSGVAALTYRPDEA